MNRSASNRSHKHLIRFDEHHVRATADWLADSAHQHFDDVAKGAIGVYFIRNDDLLTAVVALVLFTGLMALCRFLPTICTNLKTHFHKHSLTAAEKAFDKELAAMVKGLDRH